MRKKNKIAKIDNQLVLKANYCLSANEQKLILFLISKIDPKTQTDFELQTVKLKDVERIFADDDKKWGSIYERMDKMCSNIMDKKITLPKGFIIRGKAITMHKYVQWFSGIEPFMDENGEISIKFRFAVQLKDFLLQLHQYVKINLLEIMPLRGKYAVRMYQIFKAERERTKQHKEVSIMEYDLEKLRAMLEIGDKYKIMKDFRRNVLDSVKKEINTHSKEISVDYKYIKTGRKVTAIQFIVQDKTKQAAIPADNKPQPDYAPTTEDIKQLSRAKLHAYEMLIEFGVKDGIILKQILPKVKGGVMAGYEDIFIKNALQHFKKWAKQQGTKEQSAATFVNWWVQKKVFSHEQDVFWKLNEKVNDYIKKQDSEAKTNRELAKDMPNEAFVEEYKKAAAV